MVSPDENYYYGLSVVYFQLEFVLSDVYTSYACMHASLNISLVSEMLPLVYTHLLISHRGAMAPTQTPRHV